MEEENVIDLLGRWVDDSRVADRNHRFPTNGNRVFCSNIVVNITTSTFIYRRILGVIVTERSKVCVAHTDFRSRF